MARPAVVDFAAVNHANYAIQQHCVPDSRVPSLYRELDPLLKTLDNFVITRWRGRLDFFVDFQTTNLELKKPN